MSRPCFALSVMLCCMAGPLLVIGKAHARDTVVSPVHDPGECIVCPLAHGLYEICGGYSDYDYNQYWQESLPPTASAATTQPAPELEAAQALTDDSADGMWAAGYEDYYADYAFGDDATATEEDLTLEETPNPVALVADATETTSVPEASPDSTASAADDYEAYEEEWFSYGSETTVETDPEADEACEARSEPASDAESAEHLETGYDAAYNEAMTDEPAAVEAATDIAPAADDYESFYNAYDDLYNFESASLEASEDESNAAVAEPVVEEASAPTTDSEPSWLTDLGSRLLTPVWTATGRIASETWTAISNPPSSTYAAECAQEWNCEAGDWAQPQTEQPSLALDAADTLDGMASLLRHAAESLRGYASHQIAETAQNTTGNPPR